MFLIQMEEKTGEIKTEEFLFIYSSFELLFF